MNEKFLQPVILITGGAGYIGSHVALALQEGGFHTVVFDNLSRGNPAWVIGSEMVCGDLADDRQLKALFADRQFAGVVHCAGSLDVGESIAFPSRYYQSNVVNSLRLFDLMVSHGVNNLIFSSSAAIFGNPMAEGVDEEHPCAPINPYGRSKMMVEAILADYALGYGLRSCCLRYFNAAGWDSQLRIPHIARHESNLIPKVLASLQYGVPIEIFGDDYPTADGTCIRDYVHVSDLAQAHLLSLQQLLNGAMSACYNLGNVSGFSVRQVIAAAEAITGRQAQVIVGPRRIGDPPRLTAESAKARTVLKWQPQYASLNAMISHYWQAMGIANSLRSVESSAN
jgi:UDP-glucose 4-epimerase